MHYPRILTIQDISCVGRCSMTVALPVLAACGVETCVLPTAVLSTHTGGFGAPHIADLTPDMAPIAGHWQRAGLMFDVISCGYLGSIEQLEHVEHIFDTLAAPGSVKIIDPAMADHGKLYAGFDENFVESMKQFCPKADWLLPNLTEACLLTDTVYRTDYDRPWVKSLLEKLSGLGCKNVILTGVSFEESATGVVVWEQGNVSDHQHNRLSRGCHGTGDLFAAVFAGALARGRSGSEAARLAADFTLSCMEHTFRETETPYGIMFEPLLGGLIEELNGGGEHEDQKA